jgi:hypothetical protein
MLLNAYLWPIEKTLCRCGIIQDLQNFLNIPTRDSSGVFGRINSRGGTATLPQHHVSIDEALLYSRKVIVSGASVL